jgi:hypothetical protein
MLVWPCGYGNPVSIRALSARPHLRATGRDDLEAAAASTFWTAVRPECASTMPRGQGQVPPVRVVRARTTPPCVEDPQQVVCRDTAAPISHR